MIYTELHLDTTQSTISVETNKFQFIIPNMAFPAVGFRVISVLSPPLDSFYIERLSCVNCMGLNSVFRTLVWQAGFYTAESFAAVFEEQIRNFSGTELGTISVSFNRDNGFYTFTSVKGTTGDDPQWPQYDWHLYQATGDNLIMAKIFGLSTTDYTDSFSSFLGDIPPFGNPSSPSYGGSDVYAASSASDKGNFDYFYIRSNLGQILTARVLSSSQADSNIIAKIPHLADGKRIQVYTAPITPFYSHTPIYYNSIEIYLTNPSDNRPLALSGRRFTLSIGLLIDNDVIKSK